MKQFKFVFHGKTHIKCTKGAGGIYPAGEHWVTERAAKAIMAQGIQPADEREAEGVSTDATAFEKMVKKSEQENAEHRKLVEKAQKEAEEKRQAELKADAEAAAKLKADQKAKEEAAAKEKAEAEAKAAAQAAEQAKTAAAEKAKAAKKTAAK